MHLRFLQDGYGLTSIIPLSAEASFALHQGSIRYAKGIPFLAIIIGIGLTMVENQTLHLLLIDQYLNG